MTKPVTGLTAFGGLPPPWLLSQLDADIAALQAALNDLATYSNGFNDTGAANAYVVNLPGGITFTLATFVRVQFKTANANTGASTLNVAGTGAVAIVRRDGSALQNADIPANSLVDVMYDGTSWELLSAPPSNPPSGTSVVGLIGNAPQGGASIAQFSANHYRFRNAAGNTLVLYNTSSFTINTATAGPAVGGRDQAAAFANGAQVHCYAIYNGTTLGGIVSLVPPSNFAGPAMPGGGYTYWCYLGSFVLVAATTNFPTLNQGGNAVFYQSFGGQVLINADAGSANTQVAAATVNLYVPTNTLSFMVKGDIGFTSTAGAAEIYAEIGVASSNYLMRLYANAPASTTAGSAQIAELPYVSAGLWFQNASVISGGAASRALSAYCTGYRVPNGG